MIGNDVIDLDLAATESNWKRKGWLDKIFTVSERQLITRAVDQNRMVWVLWSMKEAAYKIHHRKVKIRRYIPQQLLCSIYRFDDNIVLGKVQVENAVFYTKTDTGNGFVHTIAITEEKSFDEISVYFSSAYTHENVPENIFKDNAGIPFLYNAATGKREILSISHHGKYCSYISTSIL